MFGVGPLELLVIVVAALLLFGPAVVVAWLVITFVRGSSETPRSTIDEKTDPAMVVARERYAAGEITAEELQEISRTLGY